TKSFNLIHICGKGNIDNSLTKIKGYNQFEYVNNELSDLMAACDYVISRAGANSIFEFLALNKPTLLIPLSRRASRGDQILNANSFKKDGYALVVEEEELQKGILLENIKKLKENKNLLIKNMKESKANEGSDKIVSLIMESIKNNV
ncbi:MAG: glycosyltransferase, partial [Clostridium sp.]